MSTSTFSNRPIEPDDLPTLQTETFTALAPGHQTALFVGRIVASIVVLIAIIAAVIGFRLGMQIAAAMVGAWLVATVIALAIVPMLHRAKGWQVRDHDVSARSGVLTRRVSTVPFSRVQNVAVRQTFLDRTFSIGRLDVFTAGLGADLHLDGLEPETAKRLRVLVLERAGVTPSEEVEDAPLTTSATPVEGVDLGGGDDNADEAFGAP